VKVRTPQQSQVEPNAVQSDPQRCGSETVAYLQWLTQQRVHTGRVESSPPSLDAACFIFISQTAVMGLYGRNGCREACSFS